jgi:hypothetical protein
MYHGEIMDMRRKRGHMTQKMIRLILSWFGYVKVPAEAVQLMVLIDYYFKNTTIVIHPKYEKASKTLLEFLRSGRLVQ